MKKTLLCFLFLFTTTFYAQVADMVRCEGESFDLTAQIPLLIGNLDPAATIVTFHGSLSYAENDLHAFTDPKNFSSTLAKYTIYARINNLGVVTTSSFNLIVNPGMITSNSGVQPYNCYNNGSIKIEVLSGGTPPFLYSIDNGPFTSNNNFGPLYPGKYVVNVKDALGCTVSGTKVLYSTNAVSVTAKVVNNNCYAAKEGSIQLSTSGGTGPYKYSLKNKETGVELATTQSQTLFTNLAAGIYISKVTDAIDCTSSENKIEVFQPDPLLMDISTTEATCNNDMGSITIDASDSRATSYSIDNGVSFSSSNVFTNLPIGVYSIVVKYAQGCLSAVYAAKIVRASLPVVTAVVKDITCKGAVANGSITLSGTGGKEPYVYSINNGTYKSANQYNKLSAGAYSILLKDGNGCLSTTVAVVKENYLTAAASVKNQTVTVTTTGGSEELYYGISPNLEKYSLNNVFTDVAPGSHTIIVSDLLGCNLTLTVFVNAPAPLIDGKNKLNFEFKQGQTLADITVEGQNINWYSSPGSLTGKTNKTAENTLPLTTVLVDGITYYASQTIDGIESIDRLAVTAKLNGNLSTPDFVLPNFKYYPNPVQHTLSISNTASIDAIEIISASGQSILTKKINNTHSEIDLSNVSSGFYFLKVKSEGETKTIKIVKK